MQMIPGDPFSISSSMGGFVHQETHLHHLQQQIPDLNPNSNPNPNAKPNSSSAKKKRNQPGTPGNSFHTIIYSHVYICKYICMCVSYTCIYVFLHISKHICITVLLYPDGHVTYLFLYNLYNIFRAIRTKYPLIYDHTS